MTSRTVVKATTEIRQIDRMRNQIQSFRRQVHAVDLRLTATEHQALASIEICLEQAQEWILDRDARAFALDMPLASAPHSEKLTRLLALIEPGTSGSGSAQAILEMIRARSRESK